MFPYCLPVVATIEFIQRYKQIVKFACVSYCILEPQTTSCKWMFGQTTISPSKHLKSSSWNQLFISGMFQVPGIHPRNLTWNLKIMVWKMIFLFQGCILRFHVKLQGCIHHYPNGSLQAIRMCLPRPSRDLFVTLFVQSCSRQRRQAGWN